MHSAGRRGQRVHGMTFRELLTVPIEDVEAVEDHCEEDDVGGWSGEGDWYAEVVLSIGKRLCGFGHRCQLTVGSCRQVRQMWPVKGNRSEGGEI